MRVDTNDYTPVMVGYPYGVVVRGEDGYGVWDVAEVITSDGKWITHGNAFATRDDAMRACLRLLATDPEGTRSPPHP